MVQLRGWNGFYEGWLAAFLGQPKPVGQAEAIGWETLDDIREAVSFQEVQTVFLAEIRLGHILLDGPTVIRDSEATSGGPQKDPPAPA